VRSLERGWEEAGDHQASWNGLDNAGMRVPDGVYFYRLEVGSNARVVKFALLK
jgi:flagellar hook assembly protein FlgD